MKLEDHYSEEINDIINDQNNNDTKLKDQNELIISKQKNYINNLNKSLSMQLSLSQKNLSSSRLKTPLNCLLGSFEESLLNGRMNPVGVVDGFYAEIGASGSFFPEHATLPVYAAFYQVCEDIAASPYLGVINLSSLTGSKRGYRVPNKGTIQVTLFNPNNTVVKMFVVMYDLSDMPANHRTFIRQRTMYVPVISSTNPTTSITSTISSTNLTTITQEDQNMKSFLRYLIHLRLVLVLI
jgi:hypothetical protein